MSHELEMLSDGRASMFYNNQNGTPWHKLGTPVEGLATADVALKAARLNWEVVKEPIFTAGGVPIVGHHAVRRDVDGRVLGVVGDKYELLQNREAFAWADDLLGAGAKFESAGSLFGGRQVWLLARLPLTVEPVANDPTQIWLLIVTSHDGSQALGAHIVPIRVVCNNTLRLALGKAARSWNVRHTASMRVSMDEAQRALGLVRQYTELFTEELRTLASRAVTWELTKTFVDRMLPMPEGAKGALRTRRQEARDQLHRTIETGKGTDIPGVRGTAYGLYQGATEYADHEMASRGDEDQRRERSVVSATLGGSRLQFKDLAFQVVTQLVQ